MIRPRVLSHSIEPYPQEILEFSVRGYKYLRCVDQFKDDDDLLDLFVIHFQKRLKKIKILRKMVLKTSPSFDVQIKSTNIKSLVKSHSQSLQSLDISDLSCLQLSPHRKILIHAKNLKKLHINSKKAEIKDLQALKGLKSLSIDIRDTNVKTSDLYSPLTKLKNLRILQLSSHRADFNKALDLLNQIAATDNKTLLDIRIKAIKGNEPYDDLPELNNRLKQMITKMHLPSITAIQPFSMILNNQFQGFQNLKSLRLEFSNPDPSHATYLKMLENIPLLKNLVLGVSESNSKEFSAGVIRNLRLPSSLQNLELCMPLSLEDYILSNASVIKHAKEKFAWRAKNYFEEEPLFNSFFKVFENTKLLRKMALDYKMLDSFSSFYTNFFVSILNRLPQIQSFALCVKDCAKQRLPNEPSEGFDLALLLDSCSKMEGLQGLEVAVPNILFEGVKLSPNLSQLKEFHISVTDPEGNELEQENKTLKFTNISKFLIKLLKDLKVIAPNLKSLILNIGEVMDDLTFCERFRLISWFKNLEYLYLQFLIPKCSNEASRSVGRLLQSMKKLKTLVLQFNDSDPNTFAIKTYITYHKSIQGVLLVSNKDVWLGEAGCVKNF